MTTTTMGGNGRVPRKSLNDQIEKLDGILDMMAEAIPPVIADSVRQAVAEAVRQAVETSIRETLSNPTLLQAALALRAPTATLVQPEIKPRRTLKDLLRNARGWVGSTMKKTAAKVTGVVSSIWTRSLAALRNGYAGLRRVSKRAANLCAMLPGTAVAICGGLCRYPRVTAIALSVGVACAIAVTLGYRHSPPQIAAAVPGSVAQRLAARLPSRQRPA